MKLGAIIAIGVAGLIILMFCLGFFGFIKLEGSEVGVMQDWGGIKNELMLPGTHIYNNFVLDIHRYNIGTQKITFDDAHSNSEAEWPRIVLDVGENGGQKAWVAMSVNYHLNPDKAITIHKQGIGKTYESVVLKREIVDVVNEIARPRTALELYSGAGFVKFKNDVEEALKSNHVLKDRGLDVENTIIYKVYLDPAYESEIAGKQIAGQQKLRKIEETMAAQEEAKRIFAESQASVEKTRQTAEAAKIQMIKAAEANKEQEVLRAEAEKQKRILEAEGNRDANLANASGVLALGKAEAEVLQLKRDAMYAGESGARRASVEIADLTSKRLEGMFRGVSIVPEKTILSAAGNVPGLVLNADKNN